MSLLWNHGHSQAGVPYGSNTFKRFLELLTFHSGLGALITTFAAYSIPGVTYVTRGRVGRDAELAGAGAAAGAAAEHHHDRRVAEREGAAAPAGEPVAQREGGHGAGTVAGAGVAGAAAGAAAEHHHDRREAERETGAEPATQQQAGTGVGNGGTAATAPNGAAEGGTAQPGTRRRGGLAGLFSRR